MQEIVPESYAMKAEKINSSKNSTCENKGRIVIPAWPPITGTLTSANRKRNNVM